MIRAPMRRLKKARAFFALPLFLAALCFGSQGLAQPTAIVPSAREPVGDAREPKRGPKNERASLKSLSGVAAAADLLQSDGAEDRLRGIERLSSIGSPEAVEALLDAMEQGSSIGRDPKARLLTVRALAAHVDREGARLFLVRELSDSAAAEGRGAASPLNALTRGTAALALARSGDKKALGSLASAIFQGGPGAAAAHAALLAYPPVSLQEFVDGKNAKKSLGPQTAAFLGELGDLRSLDRLRAAMNEGDMSTQAAAALSLAKLGDMSVADKVRPWLKRNDPKLQKTAAMTLALLRAADAAQAIGVLLSADATRSFGVDLSLMAPNPALAKALATVLPTLSQEERSKAIAAIGRGGGAEAVRQLSQLAKTAEYGFDALFSLALVAGADAKATLEKGLLEEVKGASRRLWVRAALLRALRLGERVDGLGDVLNSLAGEKEKDESDRALGLFGQAALGMREPSELLNERCKAAFEGEGDKSVWKSAPLKARAAADAKACDAVAVQAIAKGMQALTGKEDALQRSFSPLLQVLASEAVLGHSLSKARAGEILLSDLPNEKTVAAAAAFLAFPDGGPLPTALLSVWAEQGGSLSPLAARALAGRDSDSLRPSLKRLLSGSDPVVRAHVAMGLAFDPMPDAVTLLVNAYRFEEDAGVRRAIVRALSERTEVQRNKTLQMARDLDPDADVRALARSALLGRKVLPAGLPAAGTVLWIQLVPNHAGASNQAFGRTARLVRPDGVAVPVVSDPDGVLLVPGQSPGEVNLELGP